MKEIKEIEIGFQNSLNTWSYIMLDLQVKNVNHEMRYTYDDLMNILILFQEVANNIAYFKNGGLGKDKECERAEKFGKALRDIVKEFCGIDTVDYYKNLN